MKMKRIAAALLALCLSAALVLPAWAAGTAAPLDEALEVVRALGILSGDGRGDLSLSRRVTRAEFVAMAVKASPGGDRVGQASTSPFPDVGWDHWAAGYVEAAVALGLASGYADGTFRPDREVTLAEGASIALALLGYGPGDFSGAYPTGQMAMYHSLKLDRGVSAARAGDALTRQDAVYLFYDLMTAKNKAGAPYLTTLGCSLNAAGEIDRVALLGGSMDGPAVVQGSWRSVLPDGLSAASVTRNGRTSTLGAIQDRDVVYWNAALGAVWAYSDKVSGVIQAVEPASSPTSVTVAGRAYSIETAAVAYALSGLGPYGPGDAVTLLLGRTGGVAAVAEGWSAQERVGIVVSAANTSFPDGRGGSYTARTVTLLSTDGQTYQYPCSNTWVKEGSVVRAAVGQDGELRLQSLSGSSLSGRVNAAGTKIGSVPLSPDAEILDVGDGRGVRIFPARLAGLTLSGDQVRYCSKNSAGEVDCLVLSGVTGDMYRYGVLTDLDETDGDGSLYCSYSFDLDGQQYSLSGSTRYPVRQGPICVKGDPADPQSLTALTAAGRGELTQGRFRAGGQDYLLSDSVAVYEHRGGAYYLSSLARAGEGDLTLSAWYDRPEADGGRIRVIIAEET